jgi:hypothetical protein
VILVLSLGSALGSGSAWARARGLRCATASACRTAVISRLLQQAFQPSFAGERLVLVPGTEGAGTPFAAVFEQGSGGTWTLDLTALVRGETGFSVTQIHVSESDNWNGVAVMVRRGQLSTPVVAKGFAVSRAALEFKCRETTDKRRGGGWFSSDGLYVHVHFDLGDPGRSVAIDRAFAGARSSDQQLGYLPIQVAVDTLGRVVEGAHLAVAPLDAAARDLFSRQLIANAERLDSDSYASVRDRYLEAAATAGDGRLLPLLARWTNADGTNPSIQRTRALAARARAAIESRHDSAR